MKHSIALILLVLVLQAQADAQPHGWQWQSPLPQGNNLYDICSDPTHEGRYVAVGDHGTILVKDDRYTWYQMTSGTTENLYAVCFSQTNGWVVGQNGIILHNADGQAEVWTRQTSGTTRMLLSVHFTDFLHGWAVGQSQTVVRTTNGGDTWSDITITGTQHYFSVFFTDYLNGWIAGASGTNGVVKKTTNGGSSWSNSLIPNKRMNSIKFVNDSVGCVVGDSGRVYTTGNRGTSWSPADSKTGSDLKDLCLKSGGEGWATGADGTVIHTTDYGNTWAIRSSPTAATLYNVESEYAVGWGGIILRVGDPCRMESAGFTHHIYGIDFGGDAVRGFAVGLNGHVHYTTDAGATWSEEATGKSNDLYALDVIAGEPGWSPRAIIVGERGTVLYGSPGYWLDRSISTTDKLNAVHRFIDGRAWVAGEWGRIWHTTDYGETWKLQHENTAYHLHAIHFTSKNYGWAAGMSGRVLKTTDAGTTWVDVSPSSTGTMQSVFFVSSYRGWVVGSGGVIYRTTDGGGTWTVPATPPTTSRLNVVRFVNEEIGWAAGAAGTIIHTTDGGETWSLQNSRSIGELRSMSFPENGIGWIGGFDGLILHTDDGGGTVTYETYESPLLDLHIPDPGEVSDTIDIGTFPMRPYASVLTGITVTIDSLTHPNLADLVLLLRHGGATDTLVAQGELSGSHIGRCRFTDGSAPPVADGSAPFAGAYTPHTPLSVFHGMPPEGEWELKVADLVSGNAGVLHSWSVRLSSGFVTGTGDVLVEVPDEFVLHQNYPNPFNPTTEIRYQVSGVSTVKLVVYDILGREVATLVEGRKEAGSHEVTFDAAGLPSGVYLCRLTAGQFVQTRKLMLLK